MWPVHMISDTLPSCHCERSEAISRNCLYKFRHSLFVRLMYGAPAKRPKQGHLAPFPEAKLVGKLAKNLVFAVPPFIVFLLFI